MTSALAVFGIGVFAAASFGIADFFGARASKNLGPVTAVFFVQSTGTLAYALWYVLFADGMPAMTPSGWVYAVGGGVLMGAGMCTLYLAFDIGPVSLASPLSAAYPLVTTVVGVAFFHAELSVAECVAIIVIVVGIMAAAGLFNVDRSERKLSTGPALALLTTALWGFGYPLVGQAIGQSGWQTVTLIQFVTMVPVIGLVLLTRRRRESVTRTLVLETLRNPYVLAAGVLQMLAVLAINVGFGLDQASGTLVVATSAAYPVITMLLALRHFEEHASKIALAGAGLSIAGVLALHAL
ncbi:GRP family sugar transporter [Mycolicibacterium sp. GCM10028919]|uniref:DMT family transporter n=1 Tax=Mycolicibacterium sp. GCM10028919 TaxID=3273401 RepID=UPI003617538C